MSSMSRPAVEGLDLTPATVARLVRWYSDHEVPEPIAAAGPAAVRWARRAAGGDWRRVTVDPDGSVTVWNWPVWSKRPNDPEVRPLPRWALTSGNASTRRAA